MNVDELIKQLAAIGVVLDSCTGQCPVQISGRYGERCLYFRASGDQWELAIHDDDDLAVDLTFADDQYDAADQGGFLRRGSYGKPQSFETAIELIKSMLVQYTGEVSDGPS